MQFIGSTKKFGYLAQEAHLAKNSILSAFDLLLKANYYAALDGYFYSSFFQLTIGLERLMKLAVVSDYMLKHSLDSPSEKYLRGFGHELDTLYEKMSAFSVAYGGQQVVMPAADTVDFELLKFLAKFAKTARYYNLNQLGSDTGAKAPLHEWALICEDAYEQYTASSIRERGSMKLFYDMDKNGIHNGFTRNLSFDGQPMQVYDILHLQMVTKKAAPILIWRVIELFRPIHFILEKMAHSAYGMNLDQEERAITIPHYEEFFYFFLSMPQDIKRRKKWLGVFNN